MKIFFLAALLFSSNYVEAETKRYGNWLAKDSIDEFTENKACSVFSQATDAGRNDTHVLFIPHDGKIVNDVGDFTDLLGLYLETSYITVLINSPDDAQVIIDGDRFEFGSKEFIEAAKSGNSMTVRINDDNRRTYTRKFSLNGFSAAWKDVSERCS